MGRGISRKTFELVAVKEQISVKRWFVVYVTIYGALAGLLLRLNSGILF
jgi:hypothetical protein